MVFHAAYCQRGEMEEHDPAAFFPGRIFSISRSTLVHDRRMHVRDRLRESKTIFLWRAYCRGRSISYPLPSSSPREACPYLNHQSKLHALMNGRKADVLHHAEDPVQHVLRDHAAALGEDEAKKPVHVDSLSMHDVGAGNHLDDLAEGVPVVNAPA